ATGDLISDSTQGDRDVTVWKSPVPLAVAGFNFGKFKVQEAKLDNPEMDVLSYANEDPPEWVQGLQSAVNNSQTGMMHGVGGSTDGSHEIVGGALGNMSTVELSKKAL